MICLTSYQNGQRAEKVFAKKSTPFRERENIRTKEVKFGIYVVWKASIINNLWNWCICTIPVPTYYTIWSNMNSIILYFFFIKIYLSVDVIHMTKVCHYFKIKQSLWFLKNVCLVLVIWCTWWHTGHPNMQVTDYVFNAVCTFLKNLK